MKQLAQSALPAGEVTLVFTDIAGSSRLWEQHGDRFIPVHQAHDAVLRDAYLRFGGHEVKTEGDAFMIVFADAASALHCAVHAQAALARYPWPPDIGPLRVRMGLHTGEPFLHRNDYYGPAVNRAAHICNAAHGGQILLSDITLSAIGNRADPEIVFQDLGDHRLKDLGVPVRLYHAERPDTGLHAFPPPRTLESQPNNLPIQRTSFVGRAGEIERIAAYLATGEKPVLFLTGPGGIGKTRLSLQAAAEKADWFEDGVWYVRLMEARDIVGAAVEIATAMNIPLTPGEPPLEEVRQYLSNRCCLLILDDANTIPQADRLIRELLSGSVSLRCLATARESIDITESEAIPLSGLNRECKEPPSAVSAGSESARDALDAAVGQTDAGRLFIERALVVNPDLKLTQTESASIRELLAELEGIPAGIERAAQLVDRIPPSEILAWLRRQLPEQQDDSPRTGSEKLRKLARKGVQRAATTTCARVPAPCPVQLGSLLQGIAEVAADRHEADQAARLGRTSLELSQAAGDELGMGVALRHFARLHWERGDRQSAVALWACAAQIFRVHNAEEYPAILRELDAARESVSDLEEVLSLTPGVEAAVALALREAFGAEP